MEDGEITINGDGETSRDFTFVENAVLMNELGLFTQNRAAINQVYNGACGDQVSLNEMIGMLENITGKRIKVVHGPERQGDVKHSKANIEKAKRLLGYSPKVRFDKGLELAVEWYAKSQREYRNQE